MVDFRHKNTIVRRKKFNNAERLNEEDCFAWMGVLRVKKNDDMTTSEQMASFQTTCNGTRIDGIVPYLTWYHTLPDPLLSTVRHQPDIFCIKQGMV